MEPVFTTCLENANTLNLFLANAFKASIYGWICLTCIVSAKAFLNIVWFQKISIPTPRRELEIPEGWGFKSPGNSKGVGLTVKLTPR